MKSFISSYQSQMRSIHAALFLCLLAALPLPRSIVQLIFEVWLGAWLLTGDWMRWRSFTWRKSLIPAIALALWVVWEAVSMIWSHGKFRDQHLSLLMLPFILTAWGNPSYDRQRMVRWLISGALLSIPFYCIILYWVKNAALVVDPFSYPTTTPFAFWWFDTYLSEIKHRLYYCTDLIIALTVMIVCRKALPHWGTKLAYPVYGAIATLFVFIIWKTGSRASLIVLIALAFIGILSLFHNRWRWLCTSIVSIVAIALIVAFAAFHPRMQYVTSDHVVHPEAHCEEYNFEPRLMIWHLALEQPSDYIGHGLGVNRATPYLVDKYASISEDNRYLRRAYNAHNQYLEVAMELGLIAALLFLIVWIAMPWCYSNGTIGRRLAIAFAVTMMLNMLTECQLSRIEGVISLMVMFVLMETFSIDQGREEEEAKNKYSS